MGITSFRVYYYTTRIIVMGSVSSNVLGVFEVEKSLPIIDVTFENNTHSLDITNYLPRVPTYPVHF